MYDKLFRHRHTIEAHLAENEASSRGEEITQARLDFDLSNQRLLITRLKSDEELGKVNAILGSILNEGNSSSSSLGEPWSQGDLGLTNLTCESVIKTMATSAKLPLGSAASWDPNKTTELYHSQVTRAASDSLVLRPDLSSRLVMQPKDRRKLESEDSR